MKNKKQKMAKAYSKGIKAGHKFIETNKDKHLINPYKYPSKKKLYWEWERGHAHSWGDYIAINE